MKKIITLMCCLMSVVFVTSSYAQDEYLLREGDVVQISVWGETTLQKEVKVLPDGSITFPLAGRTVVANTTTTDAAKKIEEKLKTYLPEPNVSLVVMAPDGYHAYVVGKVLKPGPISLGTPVTVLQALSLAGGVDKFADEDDIKIIREVADKKIILNIDYGQLLKGKNLDTNVTLMPNDTILVP